MAKDRKSDTVITQCSFKTNLLKNANANITLSTVEPKTGSERPGVSWGEWDGMLRVCFVRKNRTMRASWLGTKEVLAMIESNYRRHCSLNNIALDETEIGEDETMDIDDKADDEEWGGIMDVDEEGDDTPAFFKQEAERLHREAGGKTKSRRKKTRVAELV